jgi:hypothetical protein
MSGESPTELFADASHELRDYLRALLEIVDSQDGAAATNGGPPRQAGETGVDTTAALRERGAELLRRAADVREYDDTHPAYDRILTELAPDEGRILRLLSTQGAQPSVDVRTAGALGIGSEMVAPGLNMLGAEAGCRRLDSVHAYLNNLYRLGLIWFSREQLSDQARYQVLEAQPEVIEAMEAAGRGKTIRRNITLTPFGEDFCATCLPLHTDELEALPREPGDPPPPASERSG